MTVLDSWMYGDPEKVAIRKQEDAARKHRACGQCVHRREIEFNGEKLHGCAKRQDYGFKCRYFRKENNEA